MTKGRDLSKIGEVLASQQAESESPRLTRLAMGSDLLGKALRPSTTDILLGRSAAETALGSFGRTSVSDSIQRAMGMVDFYEKYGSASTALQKELERSLSLSKSSFGIGMFGASRTVSEEVYDKLFGSFGGTVGDVLKGLEKQPTLHHLASEQRKIMEHQSALFGSFSRATQWSDALTGLKAPDYARFIGGSKSIADEMDAVGRVARDLAATQDTLFGSRAQRQLDSMLGATATKLSLFAGSIDVLGPSSASTLAAYDSLMGSYDAATAPVHRSYWARPDERARYYRDQNVDDGLIDAEAAATVTALVETGVVEGRLTRRGTVKAVLEIGEVRMEIVASRPKASARDVIDAFETKLREFIGAQLEAVAGDEWFKHRVSGDIARKAKEKRRDAMRAGENKLPLIHYVDLGELIHIILPTDNWKIFGPIFDRPDWLRTDLERLNALRRPAAHSRPIDAVQLAEIIMTIRKLTGWMQRDPDWLSGWDDDI